MMGLFLMSSHNPADEPTVYKGHNKTHFATKVDEEMRVNN